MTDRRSNAIDQIRRLMSSDRPKAPHEGEEPFGSPEDGPMRRDYRLARFEASARPATSPRRRRSA